MDSREIDDSRLKRVEIIEVPITATNMTETLSFLKEELDNIKGKYICLSNVHTCVMAHDDPAYWDVQTGSLMSLPDGKPLSIIGRRSAPEIDRVTGPDLMREIFTVSEETGWRHFFYGNTDENLERLEVALRKKWPKLKIVGMEPSVFRPLDEKEESDLAGLISTSGADFAWIALGAPRQEMLCSHLEDRVPSLLVGVGGAFNILAEVIPEAPQWMQDMSLEWLYRFIQEPRRLFMRYLVTNTKFIVYQLASIKRKGGNNGQF